MAEIKVEKRRKPAWPWIIGALAIILAAFLFLNRDNFEETENPVASTGTNQQEGVAGGKSDSDNEISTSASEITGSDCIQKFSSFVQNNKAKAMEGVHHSYTHDGLKYLSCSLESLIDQNNVKNAELDKKQSQLSQTAEAVQKNVDSDDHISKIKDAFKESVDILETIQEENYPELKDKVAEVRKAASSLETKTSTLEQKDELARFFEKASEVVTEMNTKG